MAGPGDAYGSGLMEAGTRPLRATLARSTRTLARSTRRPWTRVRGFDAVAALGLWAAFLAVSRGGRAGRGWLAAQVALAIGLQAAIRSPW